MKSTLFCLLSAFLLFNPLLGQETTANEPQTKSPQEVVEAVLQAMEEGDSAAVRSLCVENPLFFTTWTDQEGNAQLHHDPEDFQRWLESIGSPHEKPLIEKLWDVELKKDGNLAMVWANYALFIGPELHHCGIDLFQLFEEEPGVWKVFQISDTRRKDCEEVPKTAYPESK